MARIAVVQGLSQRVHYTYAGREPIERLGEAAPWLRFGFYEDQTIADLVEDLEADRVDGLLIASGSLQSAAIRDVVESAPFIAAARDAHARGVGITILYQSVTGEGMPLPYLPERYQARLVARERFEPSPQRVGAYRLSVAGGNGAGFEKLGEIPGEGRRSLEYSLGLADEHLWRRAVEDRGTSEPLLVRTVGTDAPVVLSSLPLDWQTNGEPLAAIVARSARRRGVLYVAGEDFAPPLPAEAQPHVQRRIAHGRFLHVAQEPSPGELDLGGSVAHFFNSVLFAPDIPLHRVAALASADEHPHLRYKLENGGTVAAFAPGPDGAKILVELAGPPAYARRASRFAEWAAAYVSPEGLGSFLLDLRAFATLANTVRDVFQDEQAISAGLAVENVRPVLVRVAEQRIGTDGTVKGRTIGVGALASALLAVGEAERAQPALDFLASRLAVPGDGDPEEAAQVLVWLRGAPTLDGARGVWREHVRKHGTTGVYSELLLASPESIESLLARLTAPDADPVTQAEVVLGLWESGDSGLDDRIAEGASGLNGTFEHLLEGRFSIEAVALACAALIRVEARESLTTAALEIPARRVDGHAVRIADLEAAVSARELQSQVARASADQLRAAAREGAVFAAGAGVVALVAAGVVALLALPLDTGWILTTTGAFTLAVLGVWRQWVRDRQLFVLRWPWES